MSLKIWIKNKLRSMLGILDILHKEELLMEKIQQNAARLEQISGDILALAGTLREIREELLMTKNSAYQLHYLYQPFQEIIREKKSIPLQNQVIVKTEHPVALESDDHKFPRGTKNDNTHCPRFCIQCEGIFKKKLRFLDLGCAGGGLVWDFLVRGHFALGLEGSDYSLKNQRAEWGVIADYLYTCDITKPFQILDKSTEHPFQFDVISAWEVLEHIEEKDLSSLFENIRNHLTPDGVFCASVSILEEQNPHTGARWHRTVRGQDWWLNFFKNHSFEIQRELFGPLDFPRGSGNGALDPCFLEDPTMGFHIVAKKNG